jgi:aldose 1-epimerase
MPGHPHRQRNRKTMLTPASVTLIDGASWCTVLPDIGGSLGNWSIGNQNMLRTASAQAVAARDPLGLSSFPLVPFSNRIGRAEFGWDGHQYTLAANFAPEPHAVHGVGWQRSWTVGAVDENSVKLSLLHSPDAHWPWPFEATQEISLTETKLTLKLTARNLADMPVPLAFGHHPYFDAAGASFGFKAELVWMTGEDALPTRPVVPSGQFDFSESAPVEGRDVDHCYAGVSGPARIDWAGRAFALEISSSPQLRAAVVYIPKGGDAFCYEPVPHINNALNLPGHAPSMPVIVPGGVFETKISFQAVHVK